ncbi:hypothetical protein [Curtobacterium sp. 9128]|uniref:hypothetical protein n=1 Tax=Curtobacterium sp. 9128 TaxID=1793722 RepID=UPI0011A4FF1A|nr:hypothetical protein [Curtobacterium sp. 9128]
MTSFICRTGATALILTIALTVNACSSTKGTPAVDAKQASDQMQSLVRDTMKAAGGEWKSTSNGPAADPCTMPDGNEGVWFSWNQIADGTSNPAAVTERVDRTWRDQGLATQDHKYKRADGETLHRVGSAEREVDSIQFNATTDQMSINVQSLCGAGNVDEFPVP